MKYSQYSSKKLSLIYIYLTCEYSFLEEERQMTNIFKGRHFLAEKDFTRAELEWLIDFAAHLKDLKQRNIPHRYLEGKNIALLFEKTSTRTRAAFTVASIDLVLIQNIWVPMTFNWARKSQLRTPQKFWAGCLTGLNSVALAKKWSKNWQNSLAYLSGMA